MLQSSLGYCLRPPGPCLTRKEPKSSSKEPRLQVITSSVLTCSCSGRSPLLCSSIATIAMGLRGTLEPGPVASQTPPIFVQFRCSLASGRERRVRQGCINHARTTVNHSGTMPSPKVYRPQRKCAISAISTIIIRVGTIGLPVGMVRPCNLTPCTLAETRKRWGPVNGRVAPLLHPEGEA
jgi:hypothetical protein